MKLLKIFPLRSSADRKFLRKAISLAHEAEIQGNLPIGAVIALDRKIIAEGQNAIWVPSFNQNRHAEIEALRNVPEHLWPRAREMSLYTTLEPCLMCLGAILLHGIGRVVYGSADDYGGAGMLAGHLPPYFEEQFSRIMWVGPAMPKLCNPLYLRIQTLEGRANLPSLQDN